MADTGCNSVEDVALPICLAMAAAVAAAPVPVARADEDLAVVERAMNGVVILFLDPVATLVALVAVGHHGPVVRS